MPPLSLYRSIQFWIEDFARKYFAQSIIIRMKTKAREEEEENTVNQRHHWRKKKNETMRTGLRQKRNLPEPDARLSPILKLQKKNPDKINEEA